MESNRNKNLSPNRILHKILSESVGSTTNRTYIICGKPGPTGKTWLWDALRKSGLNAIELSEHIFPLVEYRDDSNHYIEVGLGDATLIVLNESLEK